MNWKMSLISIGLFTLVSGPVAAESGSEITHDMIVSDAFEDNKIGTAPERNIQVYLPPDYGQTDRAYPVIYYLHSISMLRSRPDIWTPSSLSRRISAPRQVADSIPVHL